MHTTTPVSLVWSSYIKALWDHSWAPSFWLDLWHFHSHYSHIVRVIARDPFAIWSIITQRWCQEAGKSGIVWEIFSLPLARTFSVAVQVLEFTFPGKAVWGFFAGWFAVNNSSDALPLRILMSSAWWSFSFSTMKAKGSFMEDDCIGVTLSSNDQLLEEESSTWLFLLTLLPPSDVRQLHRWL